MFTSQQMVLLIASIILSGVSVSAENLEIDTRVVCNTQKQVERVVALYDGDPQRTVNSVNAALRDPKACAFYNMAYVRGQHLTTAKKRDASFQIVPLVVLGRVTGDGIDTVPPTPVFSAFEVSKTGNAKNALSSPPASSRYLLP